MAGLLLAVSMPMGRLARAEGPTPTATQTPEPMGKPAQEAVSITPGQPQQEEAFVYRREGRLDPFQPFLTEKAGRKEVEMQAEPEVLTGMRRFEPGQLSLVAIAFSERGALAMVQDSAGKGYVIRPGTLIGRFGVVDDIVPNRILIKERHYTMAGEEQFRTVEMLLKKGEGKEDAP